MTIPSKKFIEGIKEMDDKDILENITEITNNIEKHILEQQKKGIIDKQEFRTPLTTAIGDLACLTLNLHERVKELEAERNNKKNIK